MTSSGSDLTITQPDPALASPVADRRLTTALPSATETAILLASVITSVVFAIVRPHVADLYSAMSREYAARHGVGLGFWFSWYGGTVPGHYSVVEPFVAVVLGSALLGCLAAIGLVALTFVLLRDTPHRTLGVAVAAVAIAANLWSGRVPFLFGMVALVVTLVAVRARRTTAAMIVAIVVPLITPTCAAFLALAMVGVAVYDRSRRTIAILVAAATVLVTAAQGIVFGSAGPEGYKAGDIVLGLLTLLVLLIPEVPRWGRAAVALSIPAIVALSIVPNALGANFNRVIWFCLPVVVVSLARNRRAVAVIGALACLSIGGSRTVRDLIVAAAPMSSTTYYAGLRHELTTLNDLANERVEVVFDGTHTAGYAILGYAQAARGYETQSDHELANVLIEDGLTAATFRRWLDTNAVGYVALSHDTLDHNPEWQLMTRHRPGYLTPVWHDGNMTLFRVQRPTPIVPAPARAVAVDQKSMTVDVPRGSAGRPLTLRVRWSRFLEVDGGGRPARVESGPGGFTLLYAPQGCRCVLQGRF